jgi:hypothetical protein
VEGGSCNDYDYVCGEPINSFDLDGRMNVKGGGGSWWKLNQCPRSVQRALHCLFTPTRVQQSSRRLRAQRAAAFVGRGLLRTNSTPVSKAGFFETHHFERTRCVVSWGALFWGGTAMARGGPIGPGAYEGFFGPTSSARAAANAVGRCGMPGSAESQPDLTV